MSKELSKRSLTVKLAKVAAAAAFGWVVFGQAGTASAGDTRLIGLVKPVLPPSVRAARTPSKPGQAKPEPTLNLGSGEVVYVGKGKKRTAYLEFDVKLSRPLGKKVTFDFATTGGTATAGSDYTGVTGEATLKPGTTKYRVRVPLLGTPAAGGTDSVTLAITNAMNADLGTADASGVIVAPTGKK